MSYSETEAQAVRGAVVRHSMETGEPEGPSMGPEEMAEALEAKDARIAELEDRLERMTIDRGEWRATAHEWRQTLERERDEARAEAAKHRVTDALAEPLAILDDQMISMLEGQRDRQKARAESAEAEVAALRARVRELEAVFDQVRAECNGHRPDYALQNIQRTVLRALTPPRAEESS